jgi:CYTH domain-containing protein
MKEVLEIERKWLIRDGVIFPEGLEVNKIKITQVYLASEKKERLRTSQVGNELKYTHTIKRPAEGGGNWELERDISPEEYCELVLRADKDCYIILKERNVFYLGGLKYELDIFSHPIKLQILEVEIESLDQEVYIPEWLGMTIEVTNIKGFSNKRIASKPDVTLRKIEEVLK